MTSPCCGCGGKEKTPCDEQAPCYEDTFGSRCIADWPAEELYQEIAMIFINGNPKLNLGLVNFRLAIPYTGFGFGCYHAVGYPISPDCQVGFCPTPQNPQNTCGPPAGSSVGCTGFCYSTYGLGGFEDLQWRAQVYYPNQFLSACRGCGPNEPWGSLTWGLPAKTGVPRCCGLWECGCGGGLCTFTQQPMPDWNLHVPNVSLPLITNTNPGSFGPILEPSSGGHPCCGTVGWTPACPGAQQFNPPYRRGLLFMHTDTYSSGSQASECEHPDAFDVHVTRKLWVLPNFSGGDNCIRLIAAVYFTKTFYDRIPDIHTNEPGGQYPPPRDCCHDVGLAYVDPCSSDDAHPVQSTGWYYMDIYSEDTADVVNKRPLRLFRIEHSINPCIVCGHEEQVISNANGQCLGYSCVHTPSGQACESMPDPPCAVDSTGSITVDPEDCREFPSGIAEVPCAPPPYPFQSPEPPPNSHFDFPESIHITTV